MEVKELMIGDIVYYNESIVKVTSINPFVVGFTYCDTNEGDASTDMCIDPIPLTEEILLTNGFVKVIDVDIINYEKDGVTIEVGINHKRFNDGGMYLHGVLEKLYYVHQLQHALRLCGLNDLADNFKIE